MEQNRLERITAVIRSFDKLVYCMYCKQNTRLSISIRNHNQNVNWRGIKSLVCHMMCGRQLRDMSMSNLSEAFGNGQRQNYDSVGAYLEELFKRCEKFAGREKRDFILFKFRTFVFVSLAGVFTFIFLELGFIFVAIEKPYKIAFALFELGSIMCLVCSFVFAWGFFWNILFSAIFVVRTLTYFIVATKVAVEMYQKEVSKDTEAIFIDKAITDFDKNKTSIKKLIKRIGELECRSRLQNELMQGEEQQSVINNVKSDINDVPLMVIAEGKVEII